MCSTENNINILPEHNLLRRYIFPNPPNLTLIKENGEICSTCFHLKPNENGISVNLEHLTTLEESIIDRTKYRLLRLRAGAVQQINLTIEHSPEPNNYSHSLIKGVIDRKTGRKLASIAVKVKFP